ncbi:hypothetical protein CRV24_005047 [Beauveria bassiana]|nr:hypothetical protein CRV24_005047 [Beauveria bassiana]
MGETPMDLASMDKHWNFSNFEETDIAAYVVAVCICGYSDMADMAPLRLRRNSDHDPVFDSDGEDSGGQGRAVKLEASPAWQPERPAREGTILVTSLAAGWHHGDAIVKRLRFTVVTPEMTVQAVIENICHNARHRYLFTDAGEGSRYWVRTVMGDLEEAEVLREGDADDAEEVLSVVWRRRGDDAAYMPEPERSSIRRGMFTDWTIRGPMNKGLFRSLGHD